MLFRSVSQSRYPTYILALLFVLVATWIFYQTSEDVYMVLAAGITIVCFVIGYAHAHWVAQVSIALSLFVLDRFLRLRATLEFVCLNSGDRTIV